MTDMFLPILAALLGCIPQIKPGQPVYFIYISGGLIRFVIWALELFVLFEWDSIENAQKFVRSDETKEAMQNAGVVGMPAIYFVEEVAETDK
jgi:hypothetical protein